MQANTKRLTTLAMLAALAILAMLTIRFPVFGFLTLDPKDVVIVISGFLFGPAAAMVIIVITALVEMVTISETAHWGLIMNILSSTAFVIPVVLIYRRWRNLTAAIVGFVVSSITVVAVMLPTNYFVIPQFVPFLERADVVGLMLPTLLPFNLIKSALNATITIMLYKPVSIALQQAGLYQSVAEGGSDRRLNLRVLVISAAVLICMIITLIILSQRGVI